MKEKIAIIGTGIAGMSAAYFLKDEFDLTIFEKNNYIGGHTNTVFVKKNDKEIPIDTGFMVFNHETYPYLTKLFKELDVEIKNTDMSFAVRHDQSSWEYNGSSLSGLFSQRKNILNPRFIRFLMKVNTFNKLAPKLLLEGKLDQLTINEFVQEYNLSGDFYEKFLVPMSSAVWSTPFEKMSHFPAKTLVQFFYNHGFMGLDTQFQWKTVVSGSESYKKKIIKSFKDKIKINNAALSASLNDKNEIELIDQNHQKYTFNKVIFACHADEALSILTHPSSLQKELLSKFKYQENIATLHTDDSAMPKTIRAWSSWNYIIPKNSEPFTVYYMNMLQGVSKKENYFININGESFINPSKVLKRIVYTHPLFDFAAINAQKELHKLNDHQNPFYFCGSYFKYGFHEDALKSSVQLCESLLGRNVL